jgi:hypothetical protein
MKTKKCHRCNNILPIDKFVDISGSPNIRGHYCLSCHLERVKEWHQTAIDQEKANIRKLQIVYGDYWQHYASPDFFGTSLYNERDFCPYCGTRFCDVIPNKFNKTLFHLDHMDPLDLGGEDSIRNTVFCCGPCNIKKGKRSFIQWLETLAPKYQKLAQSIYSEKHGHFPEQFKEGCNSERGSIDLEFAIYKTEEELKKLYPIPIVDKPPSNQPVEITYKVDVNAAIEILPEELKIKLKEIMKSKSKN